MQYNLRAEVKNNNGAASILTWRYIECNDKLEALRIAFGYACANSNEQYMGSQNRHIRLAA